MGIGLVGGQVGCERNIGCRGDGGFLNERRSEVFVKIQKKNWGGGGLG